MKILVTGAAGFIGYFTARRLRERGDDVVGLDSLNDYYDPALKYARLKEAGVDPREAEVYGRMVEAGPASGEIAGAAPPVNAGPVAEAGSSAGGASGSAPGAGSGAAAEGGGGYRFLRLNLEDREGIEALLAAEKFDAVCHLAAQAGVRYSLTNPHAYADANLTGFLNLLEAARKSGAGHFCYASSSSVYGLNARQPFSVSHNVDHPVSLYAATKKAGELMAHSCSLLHRMPTTGLRFFTVYGPWGRPDMAYFLFTQAVLEGRPITINNFGDMKRDFTYIDDIVEGILRVLDRPPEPDPRWDPENPDPASSSAPYRVYNIGRGRPAGLMELVEAVEAETGRTARKVLAPMPAGDVRETWADTTDLERDFGYRPEVDIRTGIGRFVRWYREFYGV